MVAITGIRSVAEGLLHHPRFHRVEFEDGLRGCRFGPESISREVSIGTTSAALFGLTELIDNNPLICTDQYSIPSLSASLASICLGPLLMSGMVQEPPVFMLNVEPEETEIKIGLERLGWQEGCLIRFEDTPLQRNLVFASATAVIPTPDDPEELADLFDEKFGSSLIIDGDTTEIWSPDLVIGRPTCAYRITLNPDADFSLVTVRAMCERNGLFQPSQVIAAINVMCGFEDSFGIRETESP